MVDDPSPPTDGLAPEVDEESRPFWEGVRRGALLLQVCIECTRERFPPMPACPYCGNPASIWKDAPTVGNVYSWVRVHQTLNDRFAAETPYVIATVELAPGCRMFGRYDGDVAPVTGQPVRPVFVEHGDWTEVRFAPTDTPGAAS